MSLKVYTARIGYRGADAVDVTRKSATPDALAFAPSWAILRPALTIRAALGALRRSSVVATERGLLAVSREVAEEARVIEEQAWALYVPAYLAEMRASYRAHHRSWAALLMRSEATLLCYCTDPERCHRTLLARDILPKLGAVYGGER